MLPTMQETPTTMQEMLPTVQEMLAKGRKSLRPEQRSADIPFCGEIYYDQSKPTGKFIRYDSYKNE